MKPGIFITGGSGLLSVNWAVAVMGRYDVTLGLHNRIIAMNGVTCRKIDLRTVDSIVTSIRDARATTVINCAAITNIEECERNPNLAAEVNSKFAQNVALACKRENVKLVHISTDHLFSGKRCMVQESSGVSPVNVYGKTKAAAEVAVMEAFPESLILRTNFFGWGPTYRRSFSDVILDSLRSGKKIELFEDVGFTPILMDLLIEAAHDLLQAGVKGVFHATGDERISKYEFGLKIASVFNLDPELIVPSRFTDRKDLTDRPLELSLDNKKMCSVIGRSLGDLSTQLDVLVIKEKCNVRRIP